jgi:HEAT repeat protein
LRSPDSNARRYAASALGGIGPEAKEAVPALITTLKDQNVDVRRYAASVLGEIGPPAVPELIAALKDQDAEVRRHAASALEKNGPEAKEAVPALITCPSPKFHPVPNYLALVSCNVDQQRYIRFRKLLKLKANEFWRRTG